MLSNSPINQRSKSVENLSIDNNKDLIRPKSLIFAEEFNRSIDQYSPKNNNEYSIENKYSLRKTKSLHSIGKNKDFIQLKQSQTNLTIEQKNIIEDFLKDYSSPYPITIHKIRPTLGIAIEGGFQDRIPLPRVVYIQPDGCAYLSSGLRVGHVIIGLNGYSMKGLYHKQAALFIASAFKDKYRSTIDLVVVEPLNSQQ